MLKGFCLFIALAMSSGAIAQTLNSLSFESGSIQPNDGSTDSGFIMTLPDPQFGNEAITSGDGGCGPTSNCDMRVVRSETVAGQQVRPRSGNYFLRMVLDKSKDYTELNNGLEKPRNQLAFRSDKYLLEHDTEAWIGFSVFVPNNFEHDTENGGLILSEISVDSSAQFLKLRIGKKGNSDESHWLFHYYTSDSDVAKGNRTIVDLGSIGADKGKWTDFVIRVRSNPFDVATNPVKRGIANAKDRQYPGNKGILQVWKATGSADSQGNRRMQNFINKVNTPIGLVPGVVQGKDKIGYSIRAYKPWWQGNNGSSTSVKGPIWIGWDEVRFGEAARHGSDYASVHPTGQACTDKCPGSSDEMTEKRPMPPPDFG